MMTSRERILTVLSGGLPDRVPWVPLIGRYFVSSLPKQGFEIESFAPRSRAVTQILQQDLNLAEIEAAKLTGGDVFYRHAPAYILTSRDCTWFSHEQNGKVYKGWKTPLGDLEEVISFSHGTDFIEQHMLADSSAVPAYLHLLKSFDAVPAYEHITDLADYIGEDGVVTMSGPLTPIQEMLQFKMGVERTTFALFDEPEMMQDIFGCLNELNGKIYRILADAPASASPVVITYEDTSTTVLSPDWYETYESGDLDAYTGILQGSGKTHIAHMCGKISLLTGQLKNNQFAGIDSVCPPTTGDLPVSRALQETGKLIIGGLEPSSLERMDPDACYQYAMQTLEEASQQQALHRFMLGSGDSVASGTPMENLRAVTRAVRDFPV